jgi:hypothetical protein
MQKITSSVELKTAILLLEIKRVEEMILLKEQFKITCENLKPVNLIKNKINELITAPDLKDKLLNSALGLVTGYLSKKVVVGATHNPIKQLLGTLLQLGVTSIVSKNPDGIKSAIMYFKNNILSKNG